MSRQVLPTAPSPTTTHLMVCMAAFHTLPCSSNICKRKNTKDPKSQEVSGISKTVKAKLDHIGNPDDHRIRRDHMGAFLRRPGVTVSSSTIIPITFTMRKKSHLQNHQFVSSIYSNLKTEQIKTKIKMRWPKVPTTIKTWFILCSFNRVCLLIHTNGDICLNYCNSLWKKKNNNCYAGARHLTKCRHKNEAKCGKWPLITC